MTLKAFECIDPGGTYHATFVVQPNRVALWTAAFDVESLEGLFDMTPAADAIPVIDAAVGRFNSDPEAMRHLITDDPLGLFGNRQALLKIRNWLAQNDGSITGVVDDEVLAT
ncbi:hypothetical protein ACFRAQ_35665 [Nocardia sp. NPDC056611]|uniref:hypothetical protein n=1 Tax=Nocardia sp. NPDC056611 TaxID=3345877 RepID=UPI0036706D03